MCLPEVENPLLEVVKHANRHWMEEVGLREVANDTGNTFKHVESSVTMMQQVFGIGCLGVGIAEHLILVVIPLGVSLVMRNIISKFVIRTLAPKTDTPLEMV